ncbi:MAG TPA: hypothetical protein DDZ76_10975 [Xanthomonadales bacterium]|nr:hypothetical protein [Xanthomonadales bacterium]
MIVLIPVLLMLAPVALVVFVVWLGRDVLVRKHRHPIEMRLVHLPGQRLRQRLDAEARDMMGNTAMLFVIPLLTALIWLLDRLRGLDWTTVQFGLGDALLVLATVIVLVYFAVPLVRAAIRRRRYREGLYAELATAQQLQRLIPRGCMVFHDVPARENGRDFNIDHVVIGPHAVFAVETKSRRKPPHGGKDSARVIYDGVRLKFPEHSETRPIEQVRAQARWLQRYLASELGESVPVVAVLSLPGWCVEPVKEMKSPDVWVRNLRHPGLMLWDRFGPVLDQPKRRRIANAIMKRYPQVVPWKHGD